MSIRQIPKRMGHNTAKQWEVDVPLPGCKKHRRYFATRREATAYEGNVRLQLAKGTFGVEVKAPLTVGDFAERYMEWCKVHNKPSTVYAKECVFKQLLPFFGHLRLDADAMRAEVEAYTTTKLKTKTAKTVKNHLAYLGRLLTLAVDRGLVRAVSKVPKPKSRPPPMDFFDFDEADKVLHAADERWRPFLLVAMRTGLRAGELLGLKQGDVDYTNNLLHVRRTRWRGQEVLPKGGRERVVPLSGDALAALKAHRHLRGQYVFCHEDGRPYPYDAVREVTPDACAAAGVKRLTLHGCRHTFASHLVMRGVQLVAVKELMGHTTLSQVLVYAHLGPSVTRDAVKLLDRVQTAD